LNILGQIDNLASLELLDAIEDYGVTVMIGSFVVAGQTLATDVFSATGFVGTGNLVFREDGLIRTLGYASAAVDACIGIDIHPGPFFDRFTRNDALDRANFDTPTIA
jgi:hypothetical protein